MHMSRLCEEIIIFASQEYKFIELSDDFTTGSSINAAEKNCDFAELIKGKNRSYVRLSPGNADHDERHSACL